MPAEPPPKLDLSPYAGRWVAIVKGRVAGVGATAQGARLAAKRSRPREEPVVLFVEENIKDDESKTEPGAWPGSRL